MHWTKLVASRSHNRLLDYLQDPEHVYLGPPTLSVIAKAMRTDERSVAFLLRPLIEAGLVAVLPDAPPPEGVGTRFEIVEETVVVGEVS